MVKCSSKFKKLFRTIRNVITGGKYQSNLFFEKHQQQSSWFATAFTFVGFIIVLVLTINVFSVIINREVASVMYGKLDQQIDFASNELLTKIGLKVSLSQIKYFASSKMNMTFDDMLKYVSKYEDEDQCSGYKCYIPGKLDQYFTMNCAKNQNYKYIGAKDVLLRAEITVALDFDYRNFSMYEREVQSVRVQCTCFNETYCFSNNSVGEQQPDQFTINFNTYYFDNISRIKQTTTKQYGLSKNTLMQINFSPIQFNLTRDIFQIMKPTFESSTFFSAVVDTVLTGDQNCDAHSTCLFFQQTLGDTITVIPRSISAGLAQIGGYISLFGLILLVFVQFHQYCFNRRLQKFLNQNEDKISHLRHHQEKTIEDLFSYEKFYEMTIELQTFKDENSNLEKMIDGLKHKQRLNSMLFESKSANTVGGIQTLKDSSQITLNHASVYTSGVLNSERNHSRFKSNYLP